MLTPLHPDEEEFFITRNILGIEGDSNQVIIFIDMGIGRKEITL